MENNNTLVYNNIINFVCRKFDSGNRQTTYYIFLQIKIAMSLVHFYLLNIISWSVAVKINTNYRRK